MLVSVPAAKAKRRAFEPSKTFSISFVAVVSSVGFASEIKIILGSPAANFFVCSSAVCKPRFRFVPPPKLEFLTKSRAFSTFSAVAKTGFAAQIFVSSLNKMRLNSSSAFKLCRK